MKLTVSFGSVVSPSISPKSLSVTIGNPSAKADAKASEMQTDFRDKRLQIGMNPPIIRQVEGETYDGEYTVIPQAHAEQVLPTRNKHMTDDVTVMRVPYFETSNIYGDTVYIASEVE